MRASIFLFIPDPGKLTKWPSQYADSLFFPKNEEMTEENVLLTRRTHHFLVQPPSEFFAPLSFHI